MVSYAGSYLSVMCGRFDNLIARDAYRGLFKAQRLPKSNFPLRYNVAPTDQIPIVRIDPRDGEREVVMARWGLVPSGHLTPVRCLFFCLSSSESSNRVTFLQHDLIVFGMTSRLPDLRHGCRLYSLTIRAQARGK